MGRPPKSALPKELAELIEQIGANIHDQRVLQQLTQNALALRSKISNTTVNEIEKQRCRDIRLSTLTALAKALNVPVLQLMQSSDVKVKKNDRARLLKASEDILRITRKITKDD